MGWVEKSLVLLLLAVSITARSPTLDEIRTSLRHYKETGGRRQDGVVLDNIDNHDDLEVEDISPHPNIFTSNRLPTTGGEVNLRYMPSVGNGHLATNIYTDTVYVNGLYNGYMGWSYRARIQALHASNLTIEGSDLNEVHRNYSLNVEEAVFTESIETEDVIVKYRVYAHHFYTRLLVTDVTIERKGTGNETITVNRIELQGNETEDVLFDEPDIHDCGLDYVCWHVSGETSEAETDDSGNVPVFLYFSDMPTEFLLEGGKYNASWTFLFSVDVDDDMAREDFEAGMSYVHDDDARGLIDKHVDSWKKVWSRGRIEVTGDLKLQKILNGCFYYLYSNLPSDETNSERNKFYGLSPGGLPNGRNGSDYYGHVFWDMETWMYPPMLMFRPDQAREMLSYRIHGMEPAFDRAALGGYSGTRFPWESAYSGVEVTPDICVECRENQQHITGDIAFAARQYISATRDVNWLKEEQHEAGYKGVDFIHQMANFWYTRPTYNDEKERYEILGVMPPDEHHQEVNNSVFTNVVASMSIYFARYAACLAEEDEEDMVPDDWLNVAHELEFTYNRERRYHEEFENFENMWLENLTYPAGIKQADVVLLGFPLMWEMPSDVRANDLEIYEELTYDEGPAMTWGMYSVGWLEMGDVERANDLFRRSYELYVREPFKIWTEAQQGIGAINFITGMGGFLQAVLFGYGGMRLRVEELDFFKPVLPPSVSEVKFHDLDYLGSRFDMRFDEEEVELVFTELSESNPLVLSHGDVSETIVENEPIVFSLEPFRIFTTSSTGCMLPVDQINVDYSPIDGATTEAPIEDDALILSASVILIAAALFAGQMFS